MRNKLLYSTVTILLLGAVCAEEQPVQQLLLSSPPVFGKTTKAGPLPPSYWDPVAWKSNYENALGDWVSARAVNPCSGPGPQPLYNGTAAPCQVYYNPGRRLIVITHRLGLAHKLVGLLGPSCRQSKHGKQPSSPGTSGKRKKGRKQQKTKQALSGEKAVDMPPDADCFDVLSVASLKARGLAGVADDWQSNGTSRALLDLWRYTVVSFAANPYARAARSYLHLAGRWKAGLREGGKCKPLSFADYAMVGGGAVGRLVARRPARPSWLRLQPSVLGAVTDAKAY